MLEPRFRVVARPDPGYGSENVFCYRVYDGDTLLHELSGDFRQLDSGQLAEQAAAVCRKLQSAADASRVQPILRGTQNIPEPEPVIASRLIPLATENTYFSSGRAAFLFLLKEIVRPQRIWLPTFVAGSLVTTVLTRSPDVRLQFYSVNRKLFCEFPADIHPEDAVVLIHYFGQVNSCVSQDIVGMLIDDTSHLLIPPPELKGRYAFGSLRKTFRIADGGVVAGDHHPIYEPDCCQAVWLRRRALDWSDLREAENMMERDWAMSDMSSQSMNAMLAVDRSAAAAQRCRNESFLARNLNAGIPLLTFLDGEIPLLHHRLFSSQQERDSLKAFLAGCGIFCSVHWPVHPYLLQRQDEIDITDAVWLADHLLSIPISDDYDERQMQRICSAADAWSRMG